jgi:DNA-binding CsgD family transcriptional regulator
MLHCNMDGRQDSDGNNWDGNTRRMTISVPPPKTLPKTRSSMAALAPKYDRLRAALERSAQAVEVGAKTARTDVLDLQRRAIAALQECADNALGLAKCVGDTACPRDMTCLHLGDWNSCNACFSEQVSRFFDQADKFVTALTAAGEPAQLVAPKTAAAVGERKSCDAFPERAASFTEAQQRVFELLVTGLPNKLIAYEIGVSEATIKAHVSAVLRKLRVRSRAQAIALSSAFERNRFRSVDRIGPAIG